MHPSYMINETLSMNFDDKPVNSDWSEADGLAPTYAVSVYKAWGSELPVVVPILVQHYMRQQRNLIYTAITRKLRVPAGSRHAIGMAVQKNKVA